ncbi:RHS repeat domain-containing protein, partial [Aquimarina spongiae]
YTGLIGNSSGRIPMQESADNTVVYTQHESKQSSAQTIAGTTIYYSNNAIPQGIAEIHTINYYDDYNFDRHGMDKPATVYGVTTTDQVRSLPTGTKVRVLDTNNWITTVTAYDNKGRAIWIGSRNHYLSTIDKTSMKLDFTGRVEETTTSHVKNGSTPLITVDTFTYDHTGRLLTQTQKINDQDVELIVNNTYDELGQLVSKKVGGTSTTLSTQGTLSGAEGLQQVDYTYNIRGWLKTINDPNNLGDDLFAFGINYNTTTENLYASKLYNGNISETIWRTANDNTKRAYGYRYDALNRFIAATDNDNKYVVSSITYDKMGNIEYLARNGWQNGASYGNMDVLAYDYDSGNKLLKVTDTGNKDYGFKDGTNTNDDFEYDDNGNMIIDRNKGISSITYNHLNLPETVSISNSEGTGTIAYIYDATGAKQKKIVTEGSSITTEYAGNYVYKNGNLEFFNQAEGIVEKEADGYKYVYQFKDHLENIRLSYKDANKDGAITQNEIIQEKNYYPFGLTHKGYNEVLRGRNHVYGFTNKEEQDEIGLGWIDITARNYNPELGRWMNLDPLAEKYYDKSLFNYSFNNPIFFIDPDGREVDVTNLVKGGTKEDTWLLINLMAELSEISGEKITTNFNGKTGKTILSSEGCKEDCKKSDSASSYIGYLLVSEETIEVSRTNRGTNGAPSNKIFLNAEQIYGMGKALEEEKLDSKTSGVGMVFLHESLHTRIGANYFKTKKDKNEKDMNNVFPDPRGSRRANETGPTVDRVNNFRREMNLPTRYIYGNNPGSLFFEIDGNKKEIKHTKQAIPN